MTREQRTAFIAGSVVPPTSAPAQPGQDKPAAPEQPAALASADLLRGEKMVEIRHNGEVYRLQATRLGKLILTK